MIGAGLVSLPASFQSAGIEMALTLMLVGVLMTMLSLYFAARAAQLGGAKQFGGLVEAFGFWARHGAETLTLLVLVGVAASLLRLAADSLEGLLPAGFAVGAPVIVMLVAGLVVLPLSLTTALLWLQNSSLIAIAALLYVVGLLVVVGVGGLQHSASTAQAPPGKPLGPTNGAWASASVQGSLNSLPVMIYALGCQVQAVPVFAELPAAAQEPVRFTLKVAGMAVIAAASAYTVAGMFGVFAFGWEGALSGDIVTDLPAGAPGVVARIMLTVSAAAVLPLLVWPMRRAIAALLLGFGCASALDESAAESHLHEPSRDVTSVNGTPDMRGGGASARKPSHGLEAGGVDDSFESSSTAPLVVPERRMEGLDAAAEHGRSKKQRGTRLGIKPPGLADLEVSGQAVGGVGVAMGFDASPRVFGGRHKSRIGHPHYEEDHDSMSGSTATTEPRAGAGCSCCEPGLLRRVWVSGLVLVLALAMGLYAPSIKAVFQIIGATGAGIMFFIFPPLSLLRLAAWQAGVGGPLSDEEGEWSSSARAMALRARRMPKVSGLELTGAWALLVVGIVLSIACTTTVVMSIVQG
jgi:amino acid permease